MLFIAVCHGLTDATRMASGGSNRAFWQHARAMAQIGQIPPPREGVSTQSPLRSTLFQPTRTSVSCAADQLLQVDTRFLKFLQKILSLFLSRRTHKVRERASRASYASSLMAKTQPRSYLKIHRLIRLQRVSCSLHSGCCLLEGSAPVTDLSGCCHSGLRRGVRDVIPCQIAAALPAKETDLRKRWVYKLPLLRCSLFCSFPTARLCDLLDGHL